MYVAVTGGWLIDWAAAFIGNSTFIVASYFLFYHLIVFTLRWFVFVLVIVIVDLIVCCFFKFVDGFDDFCIDTTSVSDSCHVRAQLGLNLIEQKYFEK